MSKVIKKKPWLPPTEIFIQGNFFIPHARDQTKHNLVTQRKGRANIHHRPTRGLDASWVIDIIVTNISNLQVHQINAHYKQYIIALVCRKNITMQEKHNYQPRPTVGVLELTNLYCTNV